MDIGRSDLGVIGIVKLMGCFVFVVECICNDLVGGVGLKWFVYGVRIVVDCRGFMVEIGIVFFFGLMFLFREGEE